LATCDMTVSLVPAVGRSGRIPERYGRPEPW
jgi:hypothetical protein